ncbi:MAG: histidinol-phosphate transaminase [Bacteroidales bacterium]|nr:histidinol-phosphate transaminase [Bacteroidales bacterium]
MKARENIEKLQPYTSARDLVKEDDLIFLDANENPFDTGLNRYPDPNQSELKEAVSKWLGVEARNIFTGNGSDEVIDLAIRCYVRPGEERIITLEPTYSMYHVQARIHNAEVKSIPLDDNFQPDVETVLSAVDERDKILFLCSPNNPTGNLMDKEKVRVLLENFNGLVFIDEAYVDFSPEGSVLNWINIYPNLVVSRTFSKAMGMAGIRLGMGFASEKIINDLSKIKYPYNVNRLTQQAALEALTGKNRYQEQIRTLVSGREKLSEELSKLSFVFRVFPSDANFLLLEVEDARKVLDYLRKKGIIIRDRSGVMEDRQLLRITVGTPEQNTLLIDELKKLNNG